MAKHLKPLKDIVTGERSTCEYCGERIAAVIDPHSGVVDWGSFFPDSETPEDFGCGDSPDTTEDGTGGHNPGLDHTPLGFRVLVDSKTYWQEVEAREEVRI